MRFWNNAKGNMAMIMALSIVPILGVVGFGLDATRQHSAAKSLQSAVDAAVLSAARLTIDDTLTDADRTAAASSFLRTNFNIGDATLETPVVTFPEAGAIHISVQGQIPTTASSLLGVQTLQIAASSGARFAAPSVVEAVLVLDTTNSMSGTPLADLKTAANQFVSDLLDPERPDVKVGIVPFAEHVNVGLSNRSADWIDVPADYSTTEEHCYMDGCTCTGEETNTWTDPETGATHSSTSCASWDCSSATEVCEDRTRTYEWFGCVKSRAEPYNNQDTRWDIDAEGFLTRGRDDCPTSEVLPMTNSPTALNAAIDGLTAQDMTYIPAGLAWGLRVVSPTEPFIGSMSDADFEAENGRRLVVLMSDGANTRSLAADGKHSGSDVAAANAQTLLACDEIKAAGVDLFVIAFNVTDPSTTTMLQNCATTFTHYSAVTDLAGLTEAFQSAAASVGDVMLFD
ncbi:MAG: TadE/TadG family type IV pilus assembly protein [Pseudomonadota bacterium]